MQKIKDSNQEYHSHNSISASGLKTIYKKSVFHHLNQKPFTSASMNFGSAVHSVLLEDSTDELATLPEDLNLKTIKGREAKEKFIKDNPDKIVITYKENNNIQKIIKNYRQNDLAMEILFSLTEKEFNIKLPEPVLANNICGFTSSNEILSTINSVISFLPPIAI